MTIPEIASVLQHRLSPATRTNGRLTHSVYGTGTYLHNLRPIQCDDGFTMSVQASRAHYCAPRDSTGPWTAVEVGYPSTKVEAFMPYIDGGEDTNPTDTVYGYVPIEIVARAIADHGGFAK